MMNEFPYWFDSPIWWRYQCISSIWSILSPLHSIIYFFLSFFVPRLISICIVVWKEGFDEDSMEILLIIRMMVNQRIRTLILLFSHSSLSMSFTVWQNRYLYGKRFQSISSPISCEERFGLGWRLCMRTRFNICRAHRKCWIGACHWLDFWGCKLLNHIYNFWWIRSNGAHFLSLNLDFWGFWDEIEMMNKLFPYWFDSPEWWRLIVLALSDPYLSLIQALIFLTCAWFFWNFFQQLGFVFTNVSMLECSIGYESMPNWAHGVCQIV